jgi:molybdenum cofactor cytidylyltransferase
MNGQSIHAVLLAAGASTRMGRKKLLMEIGGRTVFEISLRHHLESSLGGVCAVIPGWIKDFRHIMSRYDESRAASVEIGEPCEMSTSLKAGWQWVSHNTDAGGIMISLADQPLVRARTLDALVEAYLASDKPFCVPTHRGRRGHPVIMNREREDDIMTLEGDRGARGILAGKPQLVLEVEIESDEVVLDLDRPEDLIIIRSRLTGHG